jgi:hypothetical protein
MQTEQSPRVGGASGINEFCAAHKISRTKYYDLDAKGLGPKYFLVGNQRRISDEAAAEWRRRMEAMTAAVAAGVADNNV